MSEAFSEYGINQVHLRGTASARSTQLDDFQHGHQRVLLLSIADESAAGSNLTVANYVIFLSPLVAEEAQQYHATMEQAHGRAVRFGQTRKVAIWRFALRDTIDQKILSSREAMRLEDVTDTKAEGPDGEETPMPLIDVAKRRKTEPGPRAGNGGSSGSGAEKGRRARSSR